MGDATAISWTNKSWNPWQGCTRVSPGCAHCYMYTEKTRYRQDPSAVVRSKPPTFNAPLKWREPALVFTCSWSDWFHESADAWRPEAWDIIRRTPHLTYQILTKRPDRIHEHLPAEWGQGWPNVWLGVSVENQRWADARIPALVRIPAARRFLSCEPLLGPVKFTRLHQFCPEHDYAGMRCTSWHAAVRFVDWVIVGGESGPAHRPMDLAWARSLRDQCAATGAAFFFKQRSGPRSGMLDGVPDDLRVQEFPHV